MPALQPTTGILFAGTKTGFKEHIYRVVKADSVNGVVWEYANWRGHFIWRRATMRGGR